MYTPGHNNGLEFLFFFRFVNISPVSLLFPSDFVCVDDSDWRDFLTNVFVLSWRPLLVKNERPAWIQSKILWAKKMLCVTDVTVFSSDFLFDLHLFKHQHTWLHESLPVIDEFNYPAIWRQRFLFSSSSVIFRKKLTATTTTTTFINKYPSSTDHFLFAGCQVKTLPIRFFTREKRKKKIKTVRNATIAAVGFGFVSTIRATCCCICTF